MVDPIEVKLDEVQEAEIKTQKQLDMLMRDWSKPETSKQILSGLPTQKETGILSDAIKSLAGGKMGSALTAGGAAGLVGAGVMELTNVLKEMVSRSKILSTFMEQIGKALGLMLDLILLPFLPLLTMGIIWLYNAILKYFGPGITNKEKSTDGGINFNQIASDFAGNLLKALTGIDLHAIGVKIGEALVAAYEYLQEKWGELIGWLSSQWDSFTSWLSSAATTVSDSWNSFTTWLSSIPSAINASWVSFTAWLSGIPSSITAAWNSFVSWLTGIPTAISSAWKTFTDWLTGIPTAISSAWKTAIDTITGWITGIWTSIKSALSGGGILSSVGKILGFAEGGTVPGAIGTPTLAVVHGGETVTPAGKSSGNHTFIFNGLTDPQLKTEVQRILRQQGARYST